MFSDDFLLAIKDRSSLYSKHQINSFVYALDKRNFNLTTFYTYCNSFNLYPTFEFYFTNSIESKLLLGDSLKILLLKKYSFEEILELSSHTRQSLTIFFNKLNSYTASTSNLKDFCSNFDINFFLVFNNNTFDLFSDKDDEYKIGECLKDIYYDLNLSYEEVCNITSTSKSALYSRLSRFNLNSFTLSSFFKYTDFLKLESKFYFSYKDNDFFVKIGDALKFKLLELGYSNKESAEKLGLSYYNYLDLIKKFNNFKSSIKRIDQICETFGMEYRIIYKEI